MMRRAIVATKRRPHHCEASSGTQTNPPIARRPNLILILPTQSARLIVSHETTTSTLAPITLCNHCYAATAVRRHRSELKNDGTQQLLWAHQGEYEPQKRMVACGRTPTQTTTLMMIMMRGRMDPPSEVAKP